MRIGWVVLAILVSMLPSTWARASSSLEPTHISLPSGPGSIDGLGRNFAPSLASGTASEGVDIVVPPSAGGFAPHLSLDYDSSGAVTELGMGWRLAGLPRIRRRTENGLPRFDAADAFEVDGMGVACDLLQTSPGTYRPEYESGAFVRIQSAGTDTWQARDKSGTTWNFGGPGFEEAEGGNVATYLPSESDDLHGHKIAYAWEASSGYALLQSVVWNDFGDSARNEVLVSYETRPDAHILFNAGIRQSLTSRMTAIEVRHGGALVRRYELTYGQDVHSRLASVTLVGRDGASRMPTLSLSYTPQTLSPGITAMQNGPGRTPSDPDVELTDLDGDGLPDLLVTGQGTGQYRSYLNQDGTTWGAGVDWSLAASPSASLGTTGVQLADLDGDGAIDLVVKSGASDFRYFPGNSATSFRAPVPIATVPSFTFEDPDVKLADMDGDRRIDAVMTTPDGIAIGYNLNGVDWTEATLIGPVDPTQALRFSDGGHTQLCDVNGDRVEDFCYLTPGALVYWLGRGRGIFEPAQTATGVPSWDPSSPWELHDLNGDGWVDLVHVGADEVDVALARAEGQFGAPQAITGVPTKDANTVVRFADMNGSGTLDIVWIDVAGDPSTSWRYMELFPSGRAGLLSRLDNGLGKVTSIQYGAAAQDAASARAAGAPWTTRINVAMPVVREVDMDDSLGDPTLKTQYAYANGTWSPIERTFAGFGGGTETDLGDAYTPTLVTTSTFDVGLVDRQMRGRVLTTQSGDAMGVIFTNTTDAWTTRALDTAMDGRHVEYSFKSSEQVDSVEGTDVSEARSTLTEWDEDNYGDTINENRWGEVVGTNKLAGHDEALTTRTFANDTTDWILGRLATEELTDATGTRVRMRRVYYDGAPFTGLPLGQIARGDVTRQEEWVGPDPSAFDLASSTSYDADGNPLETRDARGGGSLLHWDPTDRTTLLSESRKLGRSTFTETAITDPALGELLSVTGYNGQTTSVQYDAFGRVTAIVRPGDTAGQPTVAYAYAPAAPLSRVTTSRRILSGQDAAETSENLVDGLGRDRGTFGVANGRRVLGAVSFYDARGNARRILRPRWVGDAAEASPPLHDDGPGDDSWYDATGRVIQTRSQLGIQTRHAYAPFVEQRWDGAQNDPRSPYEHTPVTDSRDGLGRVVSHASILGGSALAVTLTYDAAGDLLSKVDPEGNTATYGYDGRGRRIWATDPDAGRHQFVFDPTGNLLEHHKPDGNIVRSTYDLAGRLLTEDWDGDGVPEVVNTWDGSLESTGLLSRVIAPSGTTSFAYDERQRRTATHFTIDAQTYDETSTFDAQDRESSHGFPDGSSVRIDRDSRGAITGYGSFVTLAYDADGAELERAFSTGVTQQLTYDDDRRVLEKRVAAPGASPLLDLQWSYDGAHNLLSVVDKRPGLTPDRDRSEQYTYDNQYRLTGASGTWGQAQWSFSPSGNVLARTSSVAALQAGAMSYGASAGPHALTGILGRVIAYDAQGRMTNDGDRAYAWDGDDHLVSVSRSDGSRVANTYDADGSRRIRIETSSQGATSKTVFLDAWTDIKDGQIVRYLVHGGKRFARLANGGGASTPSAGKGGCDASAEPPGPGAALGLCVLALILLSRRRASRPFPAGLLLLILAFAVIACSAASSSDANAAGAIQTLSDSDTLLFDDALGSLAEETSSGGVSQSSFASYPFGVARWDTSNESRKFANSPRDAGVGLDTMGARTYAPDLGVWTSVDPLRLTKPERGVGGLVAADHAYAYAALSPLTQVDPDGRDPLPDWVAGGIGFAVGVVQGATPGGFLTSVLPVPESLSHSAAYQYWNGAGQILGGTVQTAAAGGEEIVGIGLDMTGVGALVGVPVNVAAAVQASSGVASIATGAAKMRDATLMSRVDAASPGETPPREIEISRSKSPEALKHLEETGQTGRKLTVDRAGTAARRRANVKELETRSGMDRDESPPAVFRESDGASVRHIPSGDNRSAGAQLGRQLQGVPDGDQVILRGTD